MLGVTRLLNGTMTPGDVLRYGRSTARGPAHLLHYSQDKRPIVVWNCTQRCNLHCMHCYADAADRDFPGEMITAEGKQLLEDLAEFRVPTVLFSGGEPLTRPDLFELAAYARDMGLRCVLSTNGTLITPAVARRIQEAGFTYVGVSLDGLEPVHDRIRGVKGAFHQALAGIRHCREEGIRVGLRFTVHGKNVQDLEEVFDLLEEERIPRCCIYHLAYAGRGDRIKQFDLTPEQTRRVVDAIFARSRDFFRRGIEVDLLTVDNHADNVYLYLTLRKEDPDRAGEVLQMLRWNGGNQSGIAIAAVDPLGNVHPDQFSWHHTFGNVRERKFGQIWTDGRHPLLSIFKDRKAHLKGRCRVCRYLDICNGNLRARAESYFGDLLAPDPGCYLTDQEIGIAPGTPEADEAARWPVPVHRLDLTGF
ncbi:MAG: radical SAM protein [Anaerolineae bacterium]